MHMMPPLWNLLAWKQKLRAMLPQRFSSDRVFTASFILKLFFEYTTPSGRILTRGYYLSTAGELTQLDSITKAPVIHHFSESITGVKTIRCFRKHVSFFDENVNHVDANLRMVFYNNGSNEWLRFRLELIVSFVLCTSALFMTVLPSSIFAPENVGLALSY